MPAVALLSTVPARRVPRESSALREALEECTAQVQELEQALGEAQGKGAALEQELERARAAKEDAQRSAPGLLGAWPIEASWRLRGV